MLERMEALFTPEALIALVTLTILEIVLGIDNVIFISILTTRLPEDQRDRARYIGLSLAMGMRILLLLTISWIIGLTAPAFTIAGTSSRGATSSSSAVACSCCGRRRPRSTSRSRARRHTRRRRRARPSSRR